MLGVLKNRSKKEDEIEDEDEELEEDGKLKPKVRKKPRKKKDVRQPWSKKERILVASVISFTILSSFVLLIFSKGLHKPKINISLPSLSSKNSEPMVLGKSDSQSPNFDEMKKSLSERLSSVKGTYGLDLLELSTGKNYGINKNEKFEGASLFKLPLTIAVYIEKEKGHINLSSTHILQESDKTGGDGVLVGMPVGNAISYKDLLSYMAKEGDNTAFNILGNKIGWSRIDELIAKVGMLNTSFKGSFTTPYDMGLLLEKFMKGELVSEASKNEIIDSLVNTGNESLIAKGVEKGIKVADKSGSEVGVVNDMAIVLAKNPYILVVMTKGQDNSKVEEVVTDLSRIVYNFMR